MKDQDLDGQCGVSFAARINVRVHTLNNHTAGWFRYGAMWLPF